MHEPGRAEPQHALADGDVVFGFRLKMVVDEVRYHPQALVFGWGSPLLVQFHHNHGIGRKFPKARLDRMHNNFIRINGAFATHLLPVPLQRHTPRAG